MTTTSSTLTISAEGQVAFSRAVLDHLNAGPGDHLAVDLLPGGRVEVHAVPRGHIDAFIGSLAQPGHPPVSIEEMGRIAAAGWAGKR